MGDRPDEGQEEEEEVVKKKKERPVRKIHVKDTDMLPDLQEDTIEFIQQGLDDFKLSKDVARHVKQQLDEKKGGTWHVIVGSHFACNTTHDAGTLINVLVDTTAVRSPLTLQQLFEFLFPPARAPITRGPAYFMH
eukprot:Sspe_Gene.4306::Locus_1416_Transcript_1_1_Confidence_1.000_Length_459::g.4306::m.4306/K10418/DYNLL; dynein light chain LC8-type